MSVSHKCDSYSDSCRDAHLAHMVTADECGVNKFGVSKFCVPESCVSHLGSELVSACSSQLKNVV